MKKIIAFFLPLLCIHALGCSDSPSEPQDNPLPNASEYLTIELNEGPLAGKKLTFLHIENVPGSVSWATLNGGVLSISYGFYRDEANKLDVAGIPMTVDGGGTGSHAVIAQGTQIGFDNLWGSFQITPTDVQAYPFFSVDVELNDPSALLNITQYGNTNGDGVAGNCSTTCKLVIKNGTTLEETELENVEVSIEFMTKYSG